MNLVFHRGIVCLSLLSCISTTFPAHAQGTAFTYQGRLEDGGAPATGAYDLKFALYNVDTGGTAVAGPATNSPTLISNGLFTVTLDFGASFSGADNWLEIAARTNGSGSFTTLIPRQRLLPTPYSIFAANANTVAASGITGTMGLAQLPSAVLTNNANGVNLSGSFSGNGAGVTNLNLPANTAGAISWQGSFALVSQPMVPLGSSGLTAADVNGDGRMDLISANYTGGSGTTLNILTNDGHNGFLLASSPAVGLAPLSVAAADFNGDGKPDLVSGNYFAASLSILTNTGTGIFITASTPSIPFAGPYSLVTADANGDNKMDIIVAGFYGDTVAALTNNGSAGFALASSVSVPAGSDPTAIVTADVNGDNKPDLVWANSSTNTISVATNSGGGFTLASAPHIGNYAASVAAADLNGDGMTDLACASSIDNAISILTNNGSGGFVMSLTLGVTNFGRFVKAVDVNGDTKADLICVSQNGNTFWVFINNGAGGFTLGTMPVIGYNVSDSVEAADLNGDGRVDLVGAGYFSARISVLLNTPTFTGTFTGDGSGLTSLGTNVPLLNLDQTFAGANTLTNPGNIFGGNGSRLTSLSAANLIGTVADGRLSGNVALLNASQSFTGVNTMNNSGNSFTGSGSGLTSLSAANISSGTVADARLSTNVATLNGAQTFSGAKALTNTANIFAGNGSGLTNLSAANLASGTLPSARLAGTYGSALSLTNASNALAGDGSALTALNAGNVGNGTLSDARLSTNVDLLGSSQTITGAKTMNNAANSFNGNGSGLTALNATNITAGTLADARLSTNVALLAASQTFTGSNTFAAPLNVQSNLLVGGLFQFSMVTNVPANNSTLVPTAVFMRLAPSSSITLNATTAIADITNSAGTILILQGTSNSSTVTINDGANTALSADHTLGVNDTLTLIYNGSLWVEISFANN